MITKNHKTTTVLVAIAALSAILVAGSVSAASDHFAFAHKKGVRNIREQWYCSTNHYRPTAKMYCCWRNLSNYRSMHCHLNQYSYRIWRRCRRTINQDKTQIIRSNTTRLPDDLLAYLFFYSKTTTSALYYIGKN